MPTRNPFQPRHVESRRGGPVKQPLSRDAIVEEALRQISAFGVEGTSLRKVAVALDTGPASLYAYVADLRELHTLVLDRALAQVELNGAPGAGWRERLQHLLRSYVLVLSASPGLAQLAFGTVAVGPNALRITERILALLAEGGLDLARAAWALDLLTLYVTAIAAERGKGLEPAAPEGPVEQALQLVSPLELPHIHAAREELLSGTGETRFAWAVEVLLHGVLGVARPEKASGDG